MIRRNSIVLIVVIILVFIVAFQVSAIDDLRNSGFTINSFTNIILALTAISNLGLVIVFYCKDKSRRLNEEKYRSKLYWFRTFILEKNITEILSYDKLCKQIIEECRSLKREKDSLDPKEFNRKVKAQFGCYTDLKRTLITNIAEMIGIIDSITEREINKLLEEYQNEFTNHLSNAFEDKSHYTFIGSINMVDRQKKDLLKKVYDFEQKLLHDNSSLKRELAQ